MTRPFGLTCVMLLAFTVTSALAQEPGTGKPLNGEATTKKNEKRVLKTFKLKHLTPQEAQSALQMLGASPRPATLSLTAVAATPASTTQPAAVAVNQRAKALFVRGTSEQVEQTQKILGALDKPAEDIEAAEFGSGHVFPLRHANPQDVAAALNQLQIPAQVLQLGKGGLIVVSSQEAVNDASEVIKALDIPEEKKPSASEEKKPSSEEPASKPAKTE